jgi:S1-C subfamily serine protease
MHFPADREPAVSAQHATLQRRDSTYALRANPSQPVWVNGQQVISKALQSGDLIQIGQCGPLLRFRLHKKGSRGYKSITEALSDCVGCARYGGRSVVGRVAIFLSAMPRELATQTSLWFRWGTLASMLLLAGSAGFLAWHNVALEQRLVDESIHFTSTSERLAAIEARIGAGRRVISTASESIVFLQLAYGFVDRDSGKPLRHLMPAPERTSADNSAGPAFLSTQGNGPVFERLFTGTAFVASEDGLLLTNRHVARPWEIDELSQKLARQGYQPVVHRFVGYLAGVKEPFEVNLVVASDDVDVAVLRCDAVTGQVKHLTLSTAPPQPGDEVIVLGYPTGMRALLARAGEGFVQELRDAGEMSFWTAARRLSEAGRIGPLATRGIVGQVSATAVVYDAETTSGGSGGPVVGLDGEVLAVNTAIMPEFGGSNLGVPAERARKLLADARAASVQAVR